MKKKEIKKQAQGEKVLKKLAVVTVDYNGHTDTGEMLESLRRVEWGEWEVKVVVVDNGGQPGLVKVVEREFPEAEVVQTGENKGFAGGYNAGLKYVREWGADYVWVVNNDTLFPDKKIAKKLMEVLEANQKAGVVSPKIWFAPGFEFHRDKYSKKQQGKVIWYAGGSFDKSNVMVKHRGIDEVDSGQWDKVEQTEFVSGCSFMAKREVWEEVGGFDEELFAYFEDVEWMMRLAKAGWERWYAGKTGMYHKVSRTAGIGSPLTDYLLTRNRLTVGMRLEEVPLRTKLALVREAVKMYFRGREAQKLGVVDAADGVGGAGPFGGAGELEVEYGLDMSIVVVNYKTAALAEKLVESIYKRGSGVEKIKAEVVMIDNASGDDCKERMKKWPQVKFVQNQVNSGFAGGYNQGMRYGRGKYLLMLNSDIEVKAGALAEIFEQAEKLGGQAVVTGKLNFPDGTVQDSCFKLPTVGGAIEEYFLGRRGSYFMYLPGGNKPVKVEGAVMACFLIPKAVINRVGWISEGSFMYFEDIEYCRRLKEAGIPVYFCPGAEFIHHHGAASKQIGLKKATEYLKKGSMFYHGPVKYALLWLVLWVGQRWGRTQTPKSRWSQ